MSNETPRDRMHELLADDRLNQLTPEDRAELEAVLAGLDDDPAGPFDEAVGRMIELADHADDGPGMPDDVRRRLLERGRFIAPVQTGAAPAPHTRAGSWTLKLALAACLALLIGGGLWAGMSLRAGRSELSEMRRVAEDRSAENQRLTRISADEITALKLSLARSGEELSDRDRQLATRAERNQELLEMLADATSRLDRATLKIALYETPEDPAKLAAQRTTLLDMAGTIRLAWKPFDVEGLPETEQRDVSGDVVWNDSLQQGYLRFAGLEINDPSTEQYQVWIIDERGLEQKVSGGVFNATEDGEVIVSIDPGIDVGKVMLFAVTVEEPGGIWVPDLKRRVVVAPRPEGG